MKNKPGKIDLLGIAGNILVTGLAGSGKTTLVNAMALGFPDPSLAVIIDAKMDTDQEIESRLELMADLIRQRISDHSLVTLPDVLLVVENAPSMKSHHQRAFLKIMRDIAAYPENDSITTVMTSRLHLINLSVEELFHARVILTSQSIPQVPMISHLPAAQMRELETHIAQGDRMMIMSHDGKTDMKCINLVTT